MQHVAHLAEGDRAGKVYDVLPFELRVDVVAGVGKIPFNLVQSGLR